MANPAQCVVDVGPNVLTIMLAIVSAAASLCAAYHANDARRNSAANRETLASIEQKAA